MTMHATREGQQVTVHANCNIELKIDGGKYVDVQITEHAGHLRYFHNQLGQLLDDAEKEAAEAKE